MLQNDQAGRHILELLTDLLADLDPHGAAVRTRKLFGGQLMRTFLRGRLAGSGLRPWPFFLAGIVSGGADAGSTGFAAAGDSVPRAVRIS
jgi:hypothetical protein